MTSERANILSKVVRVKKRHVNKDLNEVEGISHLNIEWPGVKGQGGR